MDKDASTWDRPYHVMPMAERRLRAIRKQLCQCPCCRANGDQNPYKSQPGPEGISPLIQYREYGIQRNVDTRNCVQSNELEGGDSIDRINNQLINAKNDTIPTQRHLKTKYLKELRWLCRMVDYLDALERRGFGKESWITQLKKLSAIYSQRLQNTPESYLYTQIQDALYNWIEFEKQCRHAYANVTATYNKLIRMEIHLNLLRTNSLMMLTNSDTENITDSERYGKLVSIWSTKLAALRDRNITEFSQYVINIVAPLKIMDVPRAVCFLQPRRNETSHVNMKEEGDINKRCNASASFNLGSDETPLSECNPIPSTDNIDMPQTTPTNQSVYSVPEYTLDAEDVTAECYEYECPGDYTDIYNETMQLVETYCQNRGINEEMPSEYVNRVTTLTARLLPHIMKDSVGLPIHSNAYLDASVHPLNANAPGNKTKPQKSCVNINTSKANIKGYNINSHKNVSGSTMESQQMPILPTWAHDNPFVNLLKKTNVKVVNALRCLPGTNQRYRKLICLSQGNLKDLFKSSDGTVETVDVSTLLATNDDSNIKAISPSVSGPQTVLMALLTEDLASYEIDKIVRSWFPPLKQCTDNIQTDEPNDKELNQRKQIQEFDKFQTEIWRDRLAIFEKMNTKFISKLLHERVSLEPKYQYESSGYAAPLDFVPLRVNVDFRNYAPIKYTLKSQADIHYGWMQSLFDNEFVATKLQHEDITTETTPHTHSLRNIVNGYIPNAVLVPLHSGSIEFSKDYRTITEICDCVTDYVYPPLYEQHKLWEIQAPRNPYDICQTVNKNSNNEGNNKTNGYSVFDNIDPGTTCDNRVSYTGSEHCGKELDNIDTKGYNSAPMGSVFISRHSNFCIGSQWSTRDTQWEKENVPLVFYLLCCDGKEPTIQPSKIESENPEYILQYLENMKYVLKGLEKIFELCNIWKVESLTIPATLSCCTQMETAQSTEIEETYNGHLYMRCLATVTHLASEVCKNKYPTAINLLFPEALKNNGIDTAVSSIINTRLGTF
ncbi:hypothetical protein BBOV_II002400 [Babesia bovis T2Bo]|uniref:Uncharacterized protein n=1 Tax=Babesia bovis TaxID=5865 RepID=A7ATD5_BABBO|nr:hypothetical protein BBOV_II002400 [Babesia bovis T2Bo]EDO06196.1 hypothetical protein BBOV_II002400 [Babesia bovis T2Bo]|eukprot:XP_001609764.1 hypothetical protein [Babesia bovis T2Bo]